MSSEMRELFRKCEGVLNDMRGISPCLTEQMEGYLEQMAALIARTEAGADRPVAEISELSGAKLIVLYSVDEIGHLPKGTKLYTHPQDASGNAELIEAVGTYEEAVRLFGRTSPSASRAYCRMTDVLAAMQAKEAK